MYDAVVSDLLAGDSEYDVNACLCSTQVVRGGPMRGTRVGGRVRGFGLRRSLRGDELYLHTAAI